jgi:hypothetical protein
VAFGDDKCKIPQGQPGEYVSATARDHAGSNPNNMLACSTTACQARPQYAPHSTTYYMLPTTCYLKFTTHYLLLTTHYVLLTTYYSLLTTYYSVLTTHYLLLTTNYLLFTTYYLLPTDPTNPTQPIPPHLTLQAVGHVALFYQRRR